MRTVKMSRDPNSQAPRPNIQPESRPWLILTVCMLGLWYLSLCGLAQNIPTGFRVDRYTRVWERNPFTLFKPSPPEKELAPFDKLFLASWLKEGNKEVVLVQNSETNELQRITAESNQNNLRLIEIHLDPNPQFVVTVLSDGKEWGSVKFRFDTQPATGQSASGVPQMPNNAATGLIPNAASSQANSQALGSAAVVRVDPGVTHRIFPGVPRVHIEGSAVQAPRPRKFRAKQLLASPAPEQANSGPN